MSKGAKSLSRQMRRTLIKQQLGLAARHGLVDLENDLLSLDVADPPTDHDIATDTALLARKGYLPEQIETFMTGGESPGPKPKNE